MKSHVKGLMNVNYTEEFDPSLTEEQKMKLKRFLVFRHDPSNKKDFPKYVSYYVDTKNIGPMHLDVLTEIKNKMDPSLSYRRSCREGICGSCSMNCNGTHTLACISKFD